MTLWKHECIWLCSQFLWLKRKVLVKKKNLRVFHLSFDKIISEHTAGIFGQHKALGPTVHHTAWKAHFDWQLLTVTLCSSPPDRFGPGTVQSVEEFLLCCHVMFYSYTVQKLFFVFFNQRSDLLTFVSYCCGEMFWDRSKHLLLACHPAVKFDSSGEKIRNYSLNFVIFVYFRLLHNLEPFCNHRTPPPPLAMRRNAGLRHL